MSNFAVQLKSEIQRLAGKEIRTEISSLRKSATSYRAEITALKRRITTLEATVKKLSKSVTTKSVEPEEASALRGRASGFASVRKKLIFASCIF